MNQSFDTQLIISLARDIVEQIAPEELPLFPTISADYAKKPDRILKQQTAQDNPLGFGMGGMESLLTPIIIATITQFFAQIGANTAEKSTHTLFHRLREKKSQHSASNQQSDQSAWPQLNATDLKHIHDIAYQTALEHKQAPSKAKQFADTFVANMAMRNITTEKDQ